MLRMFENICFIIYCNIYQATKAFRVLVLGNEGLMPFFLT